MPQKQLTDALKEIKTKLDRISGELDRVPEIVSEEDKIAEMTRILDELNNIGK